MTTEFVLLLGLYAFLLIGAFLGDRGPGATIKQAAPRLGAKIEHSIAIGNGPEGFKRRQTGDTTAYWEDPENQ